jgi:hypothetical protein
MKLVLPILAALLLAACSTVKTPPSKPVCDAQVEEAIQSYANAAKRADAEGKRLALQLEQQKYTNEAERKVLDGCIAKGGIPFKAGDQIGCNPPFKQTEKTRDDVAGCLARGGTWITVGDSARCSK